MKLFFSNYHFSLAVMIKKIFFLFTIFFAFVNTIFSQTKVSGIVVDKKNQPVSYANVVFKGSNEGTVSDENGKFYLESDKNYSALVVAFVGFTTKDIELGKLVSYNMKVVLNEEEMKNADKSGLPAKVRVRDFHLARYLPESGEYR